MAHQNKIKAQTVIHPHASETVSGAKGKFVLFLYIRFFSKTYKKFEPPNTMLKTEMCSTKKEELSRMRSRKMRFKIHILYVCGIRM